MHALLLSVLLTIYANVAYADASMPDPLPEEDHSTIGYPSVKAALAALHAKPTVEFRVQDGWIIASEKEATTFDIWSFPPEGHAAYPAAVKRTLSQKDNATWIEMSVHCEASKVACDNLVKEFQQLNDRFRESLRSKAK